MTVSNGIDERTPDPAQEVQAERFAAETAKADNEEVRKMVIT